VEDPAGRRVRILRDPGKMVSLARPAIASPDRGRGILVG
jgi:hypothetical protein